MIEQILVMDASGITLFSWTAAPTDKDSNLISGFFTALNVFAESERGENIKKINLSSSTFFFERVDNLIFVVITSDSEFEKLILPILADVKNSFLKQFAEVIKVFTGDVTAFSQFNKSIKEIIQNYGYFNLIQLIKEFKATKEIEGLLVIDQNNGEFLYSKAKSYIDRKTLSFLANIIVKSGKRLIEEILKGRFIQILVISNNSRYILIEPFKNTLIVEESKIPIDISKYSLKIDEKKIQNRIKKPGNLLFEVDQEFHLFDDIGHSLISNQNVNRNKQSEIIADSVTLLANSKTLVSQIFKENYFSTIIVDLAHIYSMIPLSEKYGIFMNLICENIVHDKLIEQGGSCEEFSSQNWRIIEEVFKKIRDLQSKF